MFQVTVDYTKSLAEMVMAGKYDWVNPNIIADNFPVQGKGRQDKECVLFPFGHGISSDEAIRLMAEEGCDPCMIEDLVKFGEEEPSLQREFPIVGLGSSWRDEFGHRRVPMLHREEARRSLNLRWFEGDWLARHRFLGVRKKRLCFKPRQSDRKVGLPGAFLFI